MARARIIKPSFFKNEELSECPYEARLLFIGLWTLADREGYVEYRPKRIKAELFPYDTVDVSLHVMTLHDKKLLAFVAARETPFVHILGFKNHQHPHPHEARSEIDATQVVPLTYQNVITLHGMTCNDTACQSFYPSIFQSFNPSICVPVETSSTEHPPKIGIDDDSPRKRFVPPTVDEVRSECERRGLNIDPHYFVDFYGAQDWKLSNGLKMKSWTMALSRWQKQGGVQNKKTSNDATSSPDAAKRNLEALNATYQKMFGDDGNDNQ